MANNDARQKIEEIMNDQEYQAYQDDSQGFLQALIDNVLAWMDDLLGSLTIGAGGGGIGAIIATLLVLLLVVLLVFILIKVGQGARRKRMYRDTKPLEQMREIDWSYHHHLQASSEQEQAGEYTIASRHLFLALLLYFHDIRWLEAKVWKTNWEYYEELRSMNPNAADFFYHFVLFFDQITYGKRTVTKQEFDHYRKETMTWLDTQHDTNDTTQEG
ncbi:DUF4129 domain-containing protein [Salipaludibacillus daqingensis]|uniref:DUF4129 domain-containing protein n=1 Tax=Salipaludibacillus daqingensis TaxID=3041001 RepID=UPI002476E7C2|nr:DUF4129 domain-containing protein [Salipaludibacillus daqingensis]